MGLVGLQEVAGEQHFGGAAQAAEGARVKPGASKTGKQPDAHVGRHEPRARRPDADVAGAGQVQAGAGGYSVDHGDHGFFATLHAENHVLGQAETAANFIGVAGGPALAVAVGRAAQLVEVAAGAEGAAGPGDDHDADVGIRVGLGHGVGDFDLHLVVQGVQSIGAIEGDTGDAGIVVGVVKDEFVSGH